MIETSPVVDSVLAPNVSNEDRLRIRDAIHRLMAHGSILRDEAGQREIYDWCRTRTHWLDEIADLLGFRLAWEHDNRLIQAIPQFPALLRRLRLDESLIAMALWYDYDHAMRDEGAHEVILTVQEFNEGLSSKFNALKVPSESRLSEILRLFSRFNLVRIAALADFAKSRIEILPTIRYVIPFPGIEEWNRQRDRYVSSAVNAESDGDGESEDESPN